jgi:hypothetical protein
MTHSSTHSAVVAGWGHCVRLPALLWPPPPITDFYALLYLSIEDSAEEWTENRTI